VTPGAARAGLGPLPPQSGDEADVGAFVVAEPVMAPVADLDDALDLLAALLLDAQAAKASDPTRGEVLAPLRASSCPDVRRRESRPSPRPAGGEAA